MRFLAVVCGCALLPALPRGVASFAQERPLLELPARMQYAVNARVLLLKGLHEEGTIEFSNYKRFPPRQ